MKDDATQNSESEEEDMSKTPQRSLRKSLRSPSADNDTPSKKSSYIVLVYSFEIILNYM